MLHHSGSIGWSPVHAAQCEGGGEDINVLTAEGSCRCAVPQRNLDGARTGNRHRVAQKVDAHPRRHEDGHTAGTREQIKGLKNQGRRPLHAMRHDNASLPAALCAASKAVRVAIILSGNFRTFSDPRVYMSIRHNLIDALGNAVVFIHGKLRNEVKPAEMGGPTKPREEKRSYIEQLGAIEVATRYLAQHGSAVEVVVQVANETAWSVVNVRCGWLHYLDGSSRSRPLIWAYSGQMHSASEAFRILEMYEQTHNVTFDWVAKARLDGVWMRSVAPYCAYERGTVYTAHPAPIDWFMLMPRVVAAAAMRGVWERYSTCSGMSMAMHIADCCGGGPTGAVMGAVMESRAPLVGFPYPERFLRHGPRVKAPEGSRTLGNLFAVVVMSDAPEPTDGDRCTHEFLYAGAQPYFATEANCREILDPEDTRYFTSNSRRRAFAEWIGVDAVGNGIAEPEESHSLSADWPRLGVQTNQFLI